MAIITLPNGTILVDDDGTINHAGGDTLSDANTSRLYGSRLNASYAGSTWDPSNNNTSQDGFGVDGNGDPVPVTFIANSRDMRGQVSVTAGYAASKPATIVITFMDPPDPNGNQAFALVVQNGGPKVDYTWEVTGLALTIKVSTLPVAGQTYTFAFLLVE